MTNVIEIIEELETEILSKKNILGKVYVDKVKVTNLLSQLRESIPQSIYEAEALLRQQDAVMADAERRAEAILRNATETRDKMVAESEILARAKQAADDMEHDAQRYCDEMTDSVHRKLDHELYDVACKVNDTLNMIEDLREEIIFRAGGNAGSNPKPKPDGDQ